jgi:hypothetical protein
MLTLRENKAIKKKLPIPTDEPNYLPMTFDNMVSYLSFCTTREELK